MAVQELLPHALRILQVCSSLLCLICAVVVIHEMEDFTPTGVLFATVAAAAGLLATMMLWLGAAVRHIAESNIGRACCGLMDLVLSSSFSIIFLAIGANSASLEGNCSSSSVLFAVTSQGQPFLVRIPCQAWNGVIAAGFVNFVAFAGSAILAFWKMRVDKAAKLWQSQGVTTAAASGIVGGGRGGGLGRISSGLDSAFEAPAPVYDVEATVLERQEWLKKEGQQQRQQQQVAMTRRGLDGSLQI